MSDILRIEPRRAWARQEHGALMVCAYEDEALCATMLADGAVTLADLRRAADDFDPDREIIFYCDEPGEEVSAHRAEQWARADFSDVVCLAGGISAWRKAGLPMARPARDAGAAAGQIPGPGPHEQRRARPQGPEVAGGPGAARVRPDPPVTEPELEDEPRFNDLTGRRHVPRGPHQIPR